MSSIGVESKHIVDSIIKNNGRYSTDPLVVEILEYQNIFNGGTTYKLIYKKDNADYIKSALACRSWKTFWKHKAE